MRFVSDAVAADPKDPQQFPALRNAAHEHFPPTYIVACGGDVLRDDALVMEKVLRDNGYASSVLWPYSK